MINLRLREGICDVYQWVYLIYGFIQLCTMNTVMISVLTDTEWSDECICFTNVMCVFFGQSSTFWLVKMLRYSTPAFLR